MALSPREEAVLATLADALRADDPALADALGIAPLPVLAAPPPVLVDAPIGAPVEPGPSTATVVVRVLVVAAVLLFAAMALPILGQTLLATLLVFVALPCLALRLLTWIERRLPG